MTRVRNTSFAVVMISMLSLSLAASGMAAQEGPPAHPAHIHEGTCEELDPNPAFPLTDVAAVAPDAPAGAVEASMTTVDVSLDDILAAPHAINVHESAENAANYIACGDLTGAVVDDMLIVGLMQQNDSGYAGVAMLESSDDGGTDVTVYLVPDLASGGEVVTNLEDETSAEEAAAAGEVTVPIVDFVFEPEVLEIPVGTTVTWVNEDAAPHTARSVDGVWDSDILNQGESYSYTFDEAGTFDYICGIHPSMTAQIVVTDP